MRKQAYGSHISKAQDETMRVPTAIVLMPVKSVTVADPPKTNIELTMMLVARLG